MLQVSICAPAYGDSVLFVLHLSADLVPGTLNHSREAEGVVSPTGLYCPGEEADLPSRQCAMEVRRLREVGGVGATWGCATQPTCAGHCARCFVTMILLNAHGDLVQGFSP